MAAASAPFAGGLPADPIEISACPWPISMRSAIAVHLPIF